MLISHADQVCCHNPPLLGLSRNTYSQTHTVLSHPAIALISKAPVGKRANLLSPSLRKHCVAFNVNLRPAQTAKSLPRRLSTETLWRTRFSEPAGPYMGDGSYVSGETVGGDANRNFMSWLPPSAMTSSFWFRHFGPVGPPWPRPPLLMCVGFKRTLRGCVFHSHRTHSCGHCS